MKLLGVLLIAFALFVRGDPLCAASQIPMTMSATECGDMAGGEDKHHHDRQEMAGSCATCLLAQLSPPLPGDPLVWSKPLFEIQTETQLDELGETPPTPPPRVNTIFRISII